MDQNAGVQPVILCTQCGRSFADSDLVQIAGSWVCAECKPAFLSRLMASGGAVAGARSYGGFWIRFGARFIDGLVLLVPLFLLTLFFLPGFVRSAGAGAAPNPESAIGLVLTMMVGSLLIAAIYEILMLKHRGATVGKLACGLRVVQSDGSALSWGTCIGRYFMWNVLSSGIPYINIVFMAVSSIMVAVDDEKRAIHDRVCDTRVIYSRA